MKSLEGFVIGRSRVQIPSPASSPTESLSFSVGASLRPPAALQPDTPANPYTVAYLLCLSLAAVLLFSATVALLRDLRDFLKEKHNQRKVKEEL